MGVDWLLFQLMGSRLMIRNAEETSTPSMDALCDRQARQKGALHPRATAPVATCREADLGIDQAGFRQRADGK